MLSILENLISFYIIDKNTYEIKSSISLKQNNLTDNKELFNNILKNFIKYKNKESNKTFEYKSIYISSIIIQGLFINSFNNVLICIFDKKIFIAPIKLFLLHISICYKNIYLKISKHIENNEKLFSLVFTEIFLIPFIHNFDKVFGKLKKKMDLILFGNSEYITTMVIDLEAKKIIFDIGNLFQSNYKSSFLQFKERKNILEEIIFHGKNLKQNYIKSNDKNINKIENTIKLEFRATFPKPLFIIKFFPILEGVVIIHYFNQYKLSKSQIRNPYNPNSFIYDNYKEIDISFFNLFNQLDENILNQVTFIEKFFFEYFLILGSNCKETGNIPNKLMTYKGRDYNLIYLNKDILQLIKGILMEYFKDEDDLLFKLKKKLIEENEIIENKITNANTNTNTNINTNINTDINANINTIKNELIQETSISRSEIFNADKKNNNNINKDQLELSYIDFIKIFKSNILLKNINNNRFINLNDINVIFPVDNSNLNEYSELNLTKNNIGIIKRNVVNSSLEKNNNEFNIYNNYGIMSSESKNIKTEVDNEGNPNNTNEPFNIDITNIANNAEPSKDEWGFKSILADKIKNKLK